MKILLTGTLILGLLILAGISEAAEVLKNHPAKVGIMYDFDSNKGIEVTGSAIKKDIIKNVDIDLLIGSDIGHTFNNDDKVIITGISYNKQLNDNFGIGLGVGIGLKRIENLRDTGETKYGIYSITSIRF